ncbi:chemotaxis protein CheD [Malikia granosa]|uniref:Probable chemoreceptor glutamine deamidase CheD n=1 Tax=Malikia granosa TaxID=263067 RepID=A0A2S9K5N5_9BURK|nr:chemotaxis protein CheD [Malikia granosa]PRD65705.1 chemotaxis protein CheD [Malikia granosa]
MRYHSLMMGQIYAAADPCTISTVLGSCVAVCLWDQGREVGGVNHFMLPRWDGNGLPSPRFGNIAIPKLIEAVVAAGGRRTHLVAKVFGGGNVLGQGEPPLRFNVGFRNADYALQALALEEIPVVAQRIKPDHGTKIAFETSSGEVILRVLRRMERDPGRP